MEVLSANHALIFNMAKKTKELGKESHVYDKGGNLEGLWTIDGAKAREEFGNKQFWQGVDQILRLYREINPNEMDRADYENIDKKLNNKTATGASKTGSMREAINIPYGLYLVLIDYEPRIFRDKKMRHSFMKRYPALRSIEVV